MKVLLGIFMDHPGSGRSFSFPEGRKTEKRRVSLRAGRSNPGRPESMLGE